MHRIGIYVLYYNIITHITITHKINPITMLYYNPQGCTSRKNFLKLYNLIYPHFNHICTETGIDARNVTIYLVNYADGDFEEKGSHDGKAANTLYAARATGNTDAIGKATAEHFIEYVNWCIHGILPELG